MNIYIYIYIHIYVPDVCACCSIICLIAACLRAASCLGAGADSGNMCGTAYLDPVTLLHVVVSVGRYGEFYHRVEDVVIVDQRQRVNQVDWLQAPG